MGWGDTPPTIAGAWPLSDGDLPCRPRHEVTRLTRRRHPLRLACVSFLHLAEGGQNSIKSFAARTWPGKCILTSSTHDVIIAAIRHVRSDARARVLANVRAAAA